MDPAPLVRFYFDPVSPYVWLASRALARIDAAGAQLAFQPVLFAGLLNAHGQKGPAEISAKRAYTFRDVMRQAALQGLDFRGPPGHPFNPLLALRMCLAVSRQDERRRLALALCAACWEHGEDIADPAVAERVAGNCGLDGAALLMAASDPAIKQQLAADTAQAVTDGVFGVPTLRINDELFWGADRIEALELRLRGQQIDEARLAAFLARPPRARRTPR